MSKYKIGDRVHFPYGYGEEGVIIDIKRFLGIPLYVVWDDSYSTLTVIYKYFGYSLTKLPFSLSPDLQGRPRRGLSQQTAKRSKPSKTTGREK